MISFFEAIVLAFIQGITEWLPISSSAHLAIAEHFLKIEPSPFYAIFLHFVTAIVVIFVFRNDFAEMFRAFLRRDFKSAPGKQAIYLIIASIPTALVGAFLPAAFEKAYSSIKLIGFLLLLTGLFLFIIEKRPGNEKVTIKSAVIMGLAQVITVFPGISRSGVTIGTGLLLGIKKRDAAKFSFFLGVPLLFGAGIYSLIFLEPVLDLSIFSLCAGIAVTAITSYFSIKFLLALLVKNKLWYFGVYCFVMSIFLLLI